MIHGYARVSTTDQTHELQRLALQEAGTDRIWMETASGAASSRPVLEELLTTAVAGDTLVVWRLDRLGRSLGHLVATVNLLGARGVLLRSLNEQIDTSCATGRMMIGIFGTLAQFERELAIERTQAGLAAARRSGKTLGRPRKITEDRTRWAKELAVAGRSVASIARELNVSRATVYRMLECTL